ncbi:hypothetical protein DRQ53_13660 [bacterium]|nr:MAG: hypothetical protein DRQ53_13660 [bacterium]
MTVTIVPDTPELRITLEADIGNGGSVLIDDYVLVHTRAGVARGWPVSQPSGNLAVVALAGPSTLAVTGTSVLVIDRDGFSQTLALVESGANQPVTAGAPTFPAPPPGSVLPAPGDGNLPAPPPGPSPGLPNG